MSLKHNEGSRAVTVPGTGAGTSVTPITAPCRLMGWSFSPLNTPSSEVDGSVTSPAANAVIVTSPLLAAGTYIVSWSVGLEGTPAAGTDNDNFQLRANAATQATSLNLGAVGEYPQQQQTLNLTSSGTIVIRAVAAGTAGAIYRAQLVITPVEAVSAVIMDSGQQLGSYSRQDGSDGTVILTDDGIYVSTSLTVKVITGTLSGCLYVCDIDRHYREK